MNKFWVLEEPDGADADRRRANWDKKQSIEYEMVECPINPAGHRRPTKRLTTLSVVLPDLAPHDFVWVWWECLVQEKVLQLFRGSNFTGFEVAPAAVRFARTSYPLPKFLELVVTGSAGRPASASGYKVLEVCPGCDLTEGTKIDDPTRLVDEAKWDGSDFFHVNPPAGSIFVTDRVVQALLVSPFKGWGAYSLGEMKEKFDIALPGQ